MSTRRGMWPFCPLAAAAMWGLPHVSSGCVRLRVEALALARPVRERDEAIAVAVRDVGELERHQPRPGLARDAAVAVDRRLAGDEQQLEAQLVAGGAAAGEARD